MRWFRQKKLVLDPQQEKLAARLSQQVLAFQRMLADRLNGYTSGWSARFWKMLLMSFCLMFGSYCFYLLWQAWN